MKWNGLSYSETTWETKEDIQNDGAITAFLESSARIEAVSRHQPHPRSRAFLTTSSIDRINRYTGHDYVSCMYPLNVRTFLLIQYPKTCTLPLAENYRPNTPTKVPVYKTGHQLMNFQLAGLRWVPSLR